MSREASLEMQSEPTSDSSTPSPVELVSMFQTGSVAIRAERGSTGVVAVLRRWR